MLAAQVDAYVTSASTKSDLERTELQKDKTGLFTGSYATNPATGKPVPIWVADYVLASYGTGAIMAVPAHDTRDYEFAVKFGLDIVEVVAGRGEAELPYTGDGPLINSANAQLDLNGMGVDEAKDKCVSYLESLVGLRRPVFLPGECEVPRMHGGMPPGKFLVRSPCFLCGAPGGRKAQDQLQAQGLALQPAALLGRALSYRLWGRQ